VVGETAWADARPGGRVAFRVAPSGGNDTQRLQAALDAASTAGPGAVIELAAGVFRVGRPLVGLNFDGTIRGAGVGRTKVLAEPTSIPPSAPSDLGLPANDTQVPVVILDSVDIRVTDNPCG
jgi:hypothetical protein